MKVVAEREAAAVMLFQDQYLEGGQVVKLLFLFEVHAFRFKKVAFRWREMSIVHLPLLLLNH